MPRGLNTAVAAGALAALVSVAQAAPFALQQTDLGGGKVQIDLQVGSLDDLAGWLEREVLGENIRDALGSTPLESASFNFGYGGGYAAKPLVDGSVGSPRAIQELVLTEEAASSSFAMELVFPVALTGPAAAGGALASSDGALSSDELLLSFQVWRPVGGQAGTLTLLAPAMVPLFSDVDRMAAAKPWAQLSVAAAAPVPEPAAWLLFALGAAGLALHRRRS